MKASSHWRSMDELEGHAEGGTENTRLALAAGQTDCDTGAAPDEKDPLVVLDHVTNFRHAFSIGNYHDVSPGTLFCFYAKLFHGTFTARRQLEKNPPESPFSKGDFQSSPFRKGGSGGILVR